MSAIAEAPVRHRLEPSMVIRNCLTLAWRNLAHLKANPAEILGFAIIQPLMVIVLLVYVFGGAISGDSHTYLQYALPGLIAQSAVFSVLSSGAGLNQDINNGVFDRLRSLPIARFAPLMGHLIGDMVRFASGLVMLLTCGALQGFEMRTGLIKTLAALWLAAVFGMGLAWVSMLVGLLAKSATTVHLFSSVLLFPLTFGSNVYVKTDTMPGWLAAWANVNPISHEATAMRALMSGGPLGNSVYWTLGWAAGLTLVFAPLAIRAYRRRI
ncbi:ABC transporter permease [Streptomyces sp. NBC_01387]|uniref:ABC transporter permease n=1 Tax=unclassified Streptomyces TaxID=2593676 RepID=UPI002025B0E6|nr:MULTISPECIES: ABC transporter permease [unclassified Streptomyces]MCX4547582.1 ABC transporter permease [Streptomyces sp. NBC_01500]WSV53292.1 ABC transporter permease [Streptomyces sp. NBC_01014]